MTLAIQFSSAAEFTNQPLAAEEAADQAGARFANAKLECVIKGNDVAGIDDVLAVDVDFIDRAKAIEEQVAAAAALDPKQTLATEQRFAEALPCGIDFNSNSRCQPTRSLHNQRAARERIVHDVAQESGADYERLIRGGGGEVIQEKVLAREHAFESFGETASSAFVARGRLDGEAVGHRDHRADFAGDRFTGLESQLRDGHRGLGEKLMLHDGSVEMRIGPRR